VGLVVLVAVRVWAAAGDPEAAARANNVGVALLEQFRFAEAADAFRRAQALDPKLLAARVNAGLALLHVPDLAAARRELEAALVLDPASLQAQYALGLVARQESRGTEALRRFQAVLAADPEDVGANVGAAQVLLQERRYAEAIPLLETALRVEPYQVSAAYNLGLALTRAGRREEGERATARFTELRDSPYRTSLGPSYLEQGRYAEALVTTGAEPAFVDARDPGVRFVDRSAERLPGATGAASCVALGDVDHDGDLDVAACIAGALHLLRNDGGRLVDVGPPAAVEARGVLVGDADNDLTPDLLVLGPAGLRLLRAGAPWQYTDAPLEAAAGLAARTAALVDVDHDGDLDVFAAGTGRQVLLQNDGTGRFKDVTTEAKLQASGNAAAVAPMDFDERRDVDLLVVREDGAPALYRNLRDGTFADVAAEAGLPQAGQRSAAVGDVNKDGFPDVLLGGTLALSDGRGRFRAQPAPEDAAGATGALFLDYDRDGLLDLVTAQGDRLRVARNLGPNWAGAGEVAAGGAVSAFAAGDVDGDGAQDLLAATPKGLRLLRAEGGRSRSFRVDLTGRASNRSGVGAKVEVRAGSLHQKLETVSATPAVSAADVVFGLGTRTAPDAVRILWPSGILQTEVELPAAAKGARVAVLATTELDRKPSSCPYLFAWDGERHAFVTDFLGGGEMGYWLGPGQWNTPDPLEYVRLTDRQLQPRGGRYELRVTNELEEVLFLDHARLLAVDHPADVEVIPNEGMTHHPRPYRLWAVRDARPPAGAVEDDGHDVLEVLREVDERWPDGFRLLPIRGYAEEHALTLDLGGLPGSHTLLVLTGWTDYAFSSDNVAAAQAGLVLVPPRLEAEQGDGSWRTLVGDVGIPVGRPQTIVLDLAAGGPPPRRVRLVTSMRIYWDRIAVGAPASLPDAPQEVPATRALLRERGFSAERVREGRLPFGYEYERVSLASPWKVFPGRYTRTGDVAELLAAADDVFVLSAPGDELSLEYEALPPPAAGWRRTFLLQADGFSKEMDLHSATPEDIGPLPFHGMTRYPYAAPEAYPMTEERRRLFDLYTTRAVRGVLPRLEATIAAAARDGGR
jgi:cytochrome c-type biogenesis protein CcmH/NrfG